MFFNAGFKADRGGSGVCGDISPYTRNFALSVVQAENAFKAIKIPLTRSPWLINAKTVWPGSAVFLSPVVDEGVGNGRMPFLTR